MTRTRAPWSSTPSSHPSSRPSPRISPRCGPSSRWTTTSTRDGGADAPGGTIAYEAALAGASAARDFAARSADALYVLYTGGTTGMPKGVMWRHEDVFFGAMGGAGGGGTAIETPEEIAERCLQPRTRCVPACPVHARHRALDGVQCAVHRRPGRDPDPAPPRSGRAVGAHRGRAGELPGARGRRVRPPARRGARHPRPPRISICRRCGSCSRAARSSRRR